VQGYDLLNRTFERIFVLTIRRASGRHAKLRERLQGLDYELFYGFDGAELDLAALERAGTYSEARARKVHRHGRTMQLGQVGCAMTHRAIYEKVVENGWERVLIFEDDAFPRVEAMGELEAALRELPSTWEFLYLGYEHGEVTRAWDRVKQAWYLLLAALRLIKWTPRQVLGLFPAPYSAHLRRAGKHHCTHAYAVSQSGARKLLAEQTPVAYLADQLPLKLCIGGEIEAYLTDPKFFDQDSFLGKTETFTTR
jgi:glycosyl transferase family 25